MSVNPLDPWVRPDEQCIALTSGYRLIQRLKGHRYSVDDMLVAHLACNGPHVSQRVLDLGCGIGSVLLTEAWRWPSARIVGIEAQAEHVSLARRNAVLNGCEGRVEIIGGDLRDLGLVESLGEFDLVTGTPPYFDPRAATPCADPQRAFAQFELRGGIEDYARAASRVLSPSGVFVICASAIQPDRARLALEAAGLALRVFRDVLPREDKPPFLQLLVAQRGACEPEVRAPLALRRADGQRTPEHIAIREWSGIPCGVW